MSAKVVFVIVFSALVLLVACVAAVSIVIKWKRVRNASNAVGPVFAPSINKKAGKFFISEYYRNWWLSLLLVAFHISLMLFEHY